MHIHADLSVRWVGFVAEDFTHADFGGAFWFVFVADHPERYHLASRRCPFRSKLDRCELRRGKGHGILLFDDT